MRFFSRWLLPIFSLTQPGRAFFAVTVLAHIALKVLVGLTLVFEDGYGLRSLVAPPQSLVFAGADVLVCFVWVKLLDLAVPARHQRLVQALSLAALLLFLTANFIIHSYFKSFINRGLLEFNGASTVEIADYAGAAMNGYAISFVLIVTSMFVAYIVAFPRVIAARFLNHTHLTTISLAVAGACVGYVGTLSSGQCGFLSYNPGFQLVRSYASSSARATPTATSREAQDFVDPVAPIRGNYDSALDVQLAKHPRSNVLFVLIESLPFEQTALATPEGGMPILAELAENGVSFENFRTVFPATSRSFLTYHCGIYPSAGSATATKFRPGYRCDSILDGLKKHGYRTGFFTAPMFTYDNLHKAEFMRGYDEYEDFLSLKAHARNNSVTAPAVEEEIVADTLLHFVDQDKKTPFFATYFMFWNHAPYRLPFEDISQLKPLERYKRTLAYLDQVLRSLLDRMKKSGALDDTIVVVSADHGEGFALHHDNTNHVGHVYEDDVRIPFVIHVPGMGAHTTKRQASNVDFAPTLFSLLGLPRGASWQGQDLLSSDYKPRPTLLFGRASFMTNAIVDGNLKYIEYPDTGVRMLFDLAKDPDEQQNLLTQRPSDVAAYQLLLGDWLKVVEWRSWQPDRKAHGTGSRKLADESAGLERLD